MEPLPEKKMEEMLSPLHYERILPNGANRFFLEEKWRRLREQLDLIEKALCNMR